MVHGRAGGDGFCLRVRTGVLLAPFRVLSIRAPSTLLASRNRPAVFAAAESNCFDSVDAVGGMLVFCISLVVHGTEAACDLADYLPSLAAPR